MNGGPVPPAALFGPSKPRHPVFEAAIADCQGQLERLLACERFAFPDRPGNLPRQGVYLFSDGPKHLYVGRTDNLRRRLGQHCRVGAQMAHATLAFHLAKQEAFSGLSIRPGLTPTLEASEAFKGYFAEAKARVRRLDIRVVEERDPLRQALLEMYCTVALAPEHNRLEGNR